MECVGEQLKRAREERGLTLHDVARVTKIPITALTAIERSDMARLPGGIFGRSFVRNYATQVGLDPDATARDFADEVAQYERDAAREKIALPITPDDREFAERQRRAVTLVRRGLMLVVVVLLALLGWYLWEWRRPSAADGPAQPAGGSALSTVQPLPLGGAAPSPGPFRPHL